MEREIKFRAWDEGNKIMHFDFEFIRSGVEGNDWIVFKSDKQKMDFDSPNPFFQQQLKIMQYTGLKDKNGKEIYEGDIVKAFQYSIGADFEKTEEVLQEALCEVAWKTEMAGWVIDHEDFTGYEPLVHWDSFEVIGNIYENPELLTP